MITARSSLRLQVIQVAQILTRGWRLDCCMKMESTVLVKSVVAERMFQIAAIIKIVYPSVTHIRNDRLISSGISGWTHQVWYRLLLPSSESHPQFRQAGASVCQSRQHRRMELCQCCLFHHRYASSASPRSNVTVLGK